MEQTFCSTLGIFRPDFSRVLRRKKQHPLWEWECYSWTERCWKIIWKWRRRLCAKSFSRISLFSLRARRGEQKKSARKGKQMPCCWVLRSLAVYVCFSVLFGWWRGSPWSGSCCRDKKALIEVIKKALEKRLKRILLYWIISKNCRN